MFLREAGVAADVRDQERPDLGRSTREVGHGVPSL
jgi:hypothetical protein